MCTMGRYMDGFYEGLGQMGVVPVVVLEDAKDAAPLADALVSGGLPSAEITFRTPAAAESIRLMHEGRPDILVGAGTVLTVEQATAAVAAGAGFIVSPGFSRDVTLWCLAHEVPVLPAAVTPTEVMAVRELGIDVTKFFPAKHYGGLATIETLAAPFVGHRFMPTGGVDARNLSEYLSCPSVIACGGTWMVRADLIAAGRFDEVERLSREAAAIVGECRDR